MSRRSRVCLSVVFALSALITPNVVKGDEGSPIQAGNPVSVPTRWNGYWLTQVDEGFASCTAQFVTDRIILLAAHCVRSQDTGKYYDPENKKTVFLLQYQNDSFSKAYVPLCKFTFNDWVVKLRPGEDAAKLDTTMDEARRAEYIEARRKAWQFDFALVYLNADSITGHYAVHTNEHWNGATSIGYPHDMMGGAVIQHVDGDVFGEGDVAFSEGDIPNEQVLWHGNSGYTQGASGGAWVANFSHDEGPNNNIIIGLNSFIDEKKPGAMFGPFFDDNFTALLKFTEANCHS